MGKPSRLDPVVVLVADGDPGEVIGLVDEESRWPTSCPRPHGDREPAGVGSARWPMHSLELPPPGGPFALAAWNDTDWGPVLTNSLGWIGARLSLIMLRVGACCSGRWSSGSRSRRIQPTSCCATYAAGTVPWLQPRRLCSLGA